MNLPRIWAIAKKEFIHICRDSRSLALVILMPAILMLLFWKKTTKEGIAVSIIVGITSAVGLILISPSMYSRYGLDPSTAPIPFSNPGVVSIPLSFITIVVVSLLTQKKKV